MRPSHRSTPPTQPHTPTIPRDMSSRFPPFPNPHRFCGVQCQLGASGCSRRIWLALALLAVLLGSCTEQPLRAIVREEPESTSDQAGQSGASDGKDAGGLLGEGGRSDGEGGRGSADTAGSAGQLGEGGDTICADLGEDCENSFDCCGGSCEHGICSNQAGLCVSTGLVCADDLPCCVGFCGMDGKCPPLSCSAASSRCNADEECCSQDCRGGRCEVLDGCQPLGEFCTYNRDCCSFSCTYDGWSRSFRCSPANTCLSSGEVCDETRPPCCGQLGEQRTEACELGSNGVTRCTPRGPCKITGAECAQAAECCGGFCLPDDSGYRACSETCADLGARCVNDRDCCEDAICETGACVLPLGPCLELGEVCSANEDCCSQTCDPSLSTCVEAVASS